jgi:hypothetical protein
MLVTVLDIVIDVRLVHFSNVPSPIVLSLLPNFALVSPLHLLNANVPICSVESGIVIVFSPSQRLNVLAPNVFNFAGNFTSVNVLQSANAISSISVTPSGIVTDVSPVQA